MRFQLYTRRLPATLLAALACAAAATTGISASGQSPTLQVTMESLIYDLKNPDAPRRLAAARDLGISRPTMYKLLDAHREIRWAERIPADEIERALAACAGDVGRCAELLRTPTESLRREVRRLRESA